MTAVQTDQALGVPVSTVGVSGNLEDLARVNHSRCAWASTTPRALFRDTDDDRWIEWYSKACGSCGAELHTDPDGTQHHPAFGPYATVPR